MDMDFGGGGHQALLDPSGLDSGCHWGDPCRAPGEGRSGNMRGRLGTWGGRDSDREAGTTVLPWTTGIILASFSLPGPLLIPSAASLSALEPSLSAHQPPTALTGPSCCFWPSSGCSPHWGASPPSPACTSPGPNPHAQPLPGPLGLPCLPLALDHLGTPLTLYQAANRIP